MSGLVWGLEWRIALARRRLFFLNTAVPLVLVLPIAISDAPVVHAAAVYAILFALHGTFGSAIPLVRDGEAGLVQRAVRAGIPARAMLLERASAGTCIDFLQLAPSLVVIALTGAPSGASVLMATFALLGGLWLANLLGMLVATTARSVAEAALFAAVSALFLLHMSGVFRTPPPDALSASLEAVAPFRALHESLLGLLTPDSPAGIGAMIVWAIVLPTIVGVASGTMLRVFRPTEKTR